mmetsp:Transcript_22659/g.40794  ORF Transcript_22659/g.40794 Transcript_22659/m.40794 type:complete len:309 (-) Transcript_22659:48-974(-)
MMNSMIRSPILRASKVLVDFLQEPYEKLPKIKSTVKSLPKPTKVSEFYTLEGEAVCDMSASSETYYRMNEYLNHSQIIKHKIKRTANDVTKAHNNLANCLVHLSDLFSQLEESQHHLVEHRAPNTCLSRGIRDSLTFMANFEREKAKRMDEFIGMFYKFNYCELESLKSLLKERESLAATLRKAEDKVKAVKSNLWAEGNTAKWDLPHGVDANLIRQSKEAAFALMLHSKNAKLRDHFGYYSFSCREEFERVMQDNTYIENRHFASYADVEESAREMELAMWRDFHAGLDKILEEAIAVPSFAVGFSP